MLTTKDLTKRGYDREEKPWMQCEPFNPSCKGSFTSMVSAHTDAVSCYAADAEELEAVLSERLKHSGQPPMKVTHL